MHSFSVVIVVVVIDDDDDDDDDDDHDDDDDDGGGGLCGWQQRKWNLCFVWVSVIFKSFRSSGRGILT